GDRDAAVFRKHKRLSFCGEAGHFMDDRFLLTAIKTQGLLLKKYGRAGRPNRTLWLQRSTVQDQPLQRDRHLRWLLHLSAARAPAVLDGLHTPKHAQPTGSDG